MICFIFIVGFFGEIEEDFGYFLEWFEEVEIECVGCFKYEFVDGVVVNEFFDVVFEELKEE